MKKIEIVIERCHAGFFAQACTDTYRYDVGYPTYATPWSAKRGVRRFMKALGATNWRFADEPEPEPVVKGVHPWARWEATDKNGEVFEYENEPPQSQLIEGWIDRRVGRVHVVRRVSNPVENWRETKRRVNA